MAFDCSRWLLSLWVIMVVQVTVSIAKPTLSKGNCRVVAPVELSLDCHVAAFGHYLPRINESEGSLSTSLFPASVRVVIPLERDHLACDPLTGGEDMYHDACVIVDRGGCAFQDKLRNVAAAGGAVMILVNSDDSSLMLGSVNFEAIDAVAVSVPKAQGEQIRRLVNDNALKIQVQVAGRSSQVEQAIERIQYFADISAPVAAFESFWDAVHSLSLPTLEELLPVIAANASIDSPDAFKFFLESGSLLSRWDFADEAALFAFAGAAAFMPLTTDSAFNVARVLEKAAHQLIGAGYYTAGRVLLERRRMDAARRKVKTKEREISCQIAVVQLLEAELVDSIGRFSSKCAESQNKLSVAVPSVQVAEQTLERFATLDIVERDQYCLMRAVGAHDENTVDRCCFREMTKRGSVLRFTTQFTSELYQALNLMGVFTDELGAFNSSLIFFEQADRLCHDGLSLKFRRATAMPVVFDSETIMHKFFFEELPRQLRQLEDEVDALAVVEQSVSALAESTSIADSRLRSERPEEATYLQYTITPSTMLIGYQGYGVQPTQEAIYKLRSKLFPSLSSVYAPVVVDEPSASESTRKRVGFISSWFRTHSVGKLLIGVIERLNRKQFNVVIYRCVHFLRGGDDMTERFKQAADTYVELPVDLDSAITRLRSDRLDIIVFPELGMDAWTIMLSHHRIAPVQSVFWGHPITTGNPNIDFSISSQLFVTDEDSDSRHDGASVTKNGEGSAHGQHFRIQKQSVGFTGVSERVVLFRGLSTIFTKPSDLHKRRANTDKWKGITHSSLHLPESRRLYICPQTLMKLNPRFDAAIDGILSKDPSAIVVFLASDTQKVWTEQLRRRFRRRFGKNAHRVRFLPTLPYDEFMALLSLSDVMLDPFPFGGGVTTLDALSLGIPVVTLPSAQTVVQLAAGFLRFMNATEGIVKSVDEYISFAIHVATDRSKRQQIQASLLGTRDAIYEDHSTVEDWNAFLAAAGSLRP